MRSRINSFFPVLLLLLWSSGTAVGQFVNIRLELPAGVRFESQILRTNLKSHGEEIVWIEMVAQENISFLLSYSYEDATRDRPLTVYFINDGSTDFAHAKKHSGSRFFLKMNESNWIRRNSRRIPNAWLGLPNTKKTTYYLEYN